jgi:hypothetical protein
VKTTSTWYGDAVTPPEPVKTLLKNH